MWRGPNLITVGMFYGNVDRLLLKKKRERCASPNSVFCLQVVNYGIGGHYEPHYDFARVRYWSAPYPHYIGSTPSRNSQNKDVFNFEFSYLFGRNK